MKIRHLALATACVLAGPAAQADSKNPDAKFVEHAAAGGQMEVDLGQLASQKAQRPEVKAFGERMVKDHQEANAKLAALASQKGIDVPKAVGMLDQHKKEKLAKAKAEDFDADYVKAMLKDHEKDMKDFEKEAQSGEDAEVRSFAADTLPTLRSHLEAIKQLANEK
ncbi:MAG: DUF4142 domain-containing protein [Gammaproteobacteria bacterium]|nr:DUF4142 domain-containing protein [Gammaproteobacteria bacterium]MBI5615749.1 DUF4142 domain-containing protein [Gammaproteobacteria bacterium]